MTEFPLPHSRSTHCEVCECEVHFTHDEETKECPLCWSPVIGPPYFLYVKYDSKDGSGDLYIGEFSTYEKADKAGQDEKEQCWDYWSYFVVAVDGTRVG